MITGYIKGQNLTIRTPMIAADTIDYLTAQFVFQTVDWEGCRLFSHWKCGETNYTIELSDAGKIEKEQHLNLTAGTWTVWIHGEQYRDGELIQRITTDEATLTVKATGTASGSPFPEAPASDLERINAEIADLQDAKLSPVAADAGMSKPVGATEVGQLMTSPDVFWARYDATKYADIREAFESGKMCFLRTPNGSFPLINVTDQNASFFGIRYQNDADLYRVTPADVWSRSQYKMVTSYDKTGNIDKDALAGKIPTDKAVYDAILKYATGGGGTGTDLYGSAMVTIAGPDYDNLAVESIVFPPGVTESTAQLDLLKSGAVKMFLMTESESDVAVGILDCVSFNTDGDTIAAMFAGTVVGNGGTSFIGLDTDLNDTVTVFPMVANQGGSDGGAPLILIGGNGVPTDGEYPLFVPFTSEVYTFEMLREAAATRPVWLATLTDAEDWTFAYLTAHPVLPGATNDYITFTGRYWVTPSGASDAVPAEMIPVFGRYGADGVLKILPVEWGGYVKQTELDAALAQKAGIENAVYVLKEGESLGDVPEGYALVYDPYAEEPEKDYYTKAEIDTMFGSYVNDIAELIGGEAIADS